MLEVDEDPLQPLPLQDKCMTPRPALTEHLGACWRRRPAERDSVFDKILSDSCGRRSWRRTVPAHVEWPLFYAHVAQGGIHLFRHHSHDFVGSGFHIPFPKA